MTTMRRRVVFGVILLLVVMSIVFSMIGVLAVWNPLELFGYGRG